MRLTHYADTPVGLIHSVEQVVPTFFSPHTKPEGFWVSVDGEDDWREWCLSEEFRLDRLTHVHDVVLAKDANILRLNGASDIDAFTQRFADRKSYCEPCIRWHDVARDYQGIIIAPYVWGAVCMVTPDGITAGTAPAGASGMLPPSRA